MTDFEKSWDFIFRRRSNLVQDKLELEYVHSLMVECKPESYLEIGTAEGDSLYVLGSILPETGRIHWIDKDEDITRPMRQPIEEMLKPRRITSYSGLSGEDGAILSDLFDVVLIDGGHEYATVLQDSQRFAPLAKKYVFWHDVQIPEVRQAVHDYLQDNRRREYTTFINSSSMGFGVLKL